ncbi:TIGR01244 family sulfur transferase [Paraglaciecola sp. 25GB23A]|uniref:TIGR01244 family sulfur transferase n=1 Tax=Paraglaciecola sp. 25GB23A TaxID=3156068 RepID=UPI0032AED4EB
MERKIINDSFSLSGVVSLADLVTLKKQGIDVIINSRIDGESSEQISSHDYQQTAESLGMRYVFIPVKSLEYPSTAINRFDTAISNPALKVHGFCRSGTRIVHLWALAQAGKRQIKDIVADSAKIGFDLTPIMAQLNLLTTAETNIH